MEQGTPPPLPPEYHLLPSTLLLFLFSLSLALARVPPRVFLINKSLILGGVRRVLLFLIFGTYSYYVLFFVCAMFS